MFRPTQRPTSGSTSVSYRSVAAEYPGRCVAGVYRLRFKVIYGVIALSSNVSLYLTLGAALCSRSLVAGITVIRIS